MSTCGLFERDVERWQGRRLIVNQVVDLRRVICAVFDSFITLVSVFCRQSSSSRIVPTDAKEHYVARVTRAQHLAVSDVEHLLCVYR